MLAAGEADGDADHRHRPRTLRARNRRRAVARRDLRPCTASQGTLPLPEVAAVDEVEPLTTARCSIPSRPICGRPISPAIDEADRQGAGNGAGANQSGVDLPTRKWCASSPPPRTARACRSTSSAARAPCSTAQTRCCSTATAATTISETPIPRRRRRACGSTAAASTCITNLRGGGEFGEDWHRQGALTHKQNVFDDFIAVRALPDRPALHRPPEHLAIMGGSNGGLLMGAALTQHPELFRAVVSDVGIYDMLRVGAGSQRRVQHHRVRQ